MKINNIKNVIVVGCGGTGSWLIQPLVRFLSYQESFSGNILLIDGDRYDEKNAERQDFLNSLVGFNKAEAQYLVNKRKFPNIEEQINFVPRYLGAKNIKIIGENSVVFTCVDNHTCRTLIEYRINELKNAVHIVAGNELTTGNVQYHVRKNNKDLTPSIFFDYPEIETSKDFDRAEMDCQTLSQLPSGGQILAANLTAATLMMNFFMSLLERGAKNLYPTRTVDFDVLSVNFKKKEGNMENLTIKS